MSTTTVAFTLDELVIPETLDTGTGPDFVDMVRVRNIIETAALGTDVNCPSAAELLANYQNQVEDHMRLFLIRVDGEVIGRAVLTWSHAEDPQLSWLSVEVLTEHRGAGIGASVLNSMQEISRSAGRMVVQAETLHNASDLEPLITPPTGAGHLSAADDGARFMDYHGFTLEQVERFSVLRLPIDPQFLSDTVAQANAHADDYRVHTWIGSTPEDRCDDLAELYGRMNTDAPSAGLDVDDDPWDADRVRKADARWAAAGREVLTATAEHISTGRLVAFTVLTVNPQDPDSADQNDTLVHGDHRGHRLGMLLKARNLQELIKRHPSVELVCTWNAEENRPMLDVNEALGFVAAGKAAAWKKTL